MRTPYAAELEERFFLLDSPHSVDLCAVGITTLDPFLRSLLFTDGTVTRALEAHLLRQVSVDVVEQAEVPTPRAMAPWLAMSSGKHSIRRRVAMTVGRSATPIAYAESFVVAARLPSGFMAILSASSKGIGESLYREHMESRRELLSFGLADAAAWAPAIAGATVLVRLYRLITDGRPAMLIAESFPVESTAGVHRLAVRDRLDEDVSLAARSNQLAPGLASTTRGNLPDGTGCS